MALKKYQGAPFGCQTARFDVTGIYPDSKKPGTYTEVPYCKIANSELERRLGPGTYNIEKGDFSAGVVERKASGPGWARAVETAKLAQMPHLLFKDLWDQKKFLKRKLGPGSYKIDDFIEVTQKRPLSVRGICDTREERFREQFKFCTPGPGTYGKGGVPSAVMEEKASRSAGSRGILDSDSSIDRSPITIGCDLGPGTYNLKSSTDMLLNHVVGKRGPYDLFTGERATPICYGYFAAPKQTKSPDVYKVKSFVEELNEDGKKKHGVFGSYPQFPSPPTERIYHSTLSQCPRPPNSPGPGRYDTKPLSHPENQKQPPFLSSIDRFDSKAEKFFTGNFNPVGPGRYEVPRSPSSKTPRTYKSTFLSKTHRYLYDQDRDRFLRERIQCLSLPVEERSFSISLGTPPADRPARVIATA
ncbi:lymphocyte expansion molecule [Protopterus annectens]|uniref:lymphocyte expansion molecule n=1 Tax=Protopterus annectens TaxID=7888 RepID=UPI001CFA9B5C|nr:lymphocyte expansion molecule [Protopterus annectens]